MECKPPKGETPRREKKRKMLLVSTAAAATANVRQRKGKEEENQNIPSDADYGLDNGSARTKR